jgi:hypothetical protein
VQGALAAGARRCMVGGMKRHLRQDAKPTSRRQRDRPLLTGWGSSNSTLAALLGRKSKTKVTLPVVRFLATDDEDERPKDR